MTQSSSSVGIGAEEAAQCSDTGNLKRAKAQRGMEDQTSHGQLNDILK